MSDIYTKSVLTFIAIFLGILVLQNAARPARADDQCGSHLNPCHVTMEDECGGSHLSPCHVAVDIENWPPEAPRVP